MSVSVCLGLPFRLFRGKIHLSLLCRNVPKKDERCRKVMLLGFCFCCLESTHQAQPCSKLCAGCNGAHHLMLCGKHLSTANCTSTGSVTSSGLHHDQSNSVPLTTPGSEMHTLLRTVKVQCCNGNRHLTILFVIQKGNMLQSLLYKGKASRSFCGD